MNASELLAKVSELFSGALNADEGFRFGNALAEVRGILVCWMCDPDAIVEITLVPIGTASGALRISATAASGIVAVDDGGTWAGVTDLGLPFP